MNVFISEPVIAKATTAKSASGGRGVNLVIMAMPERPIPSSTRASTYLSTIQSKTAPNCVCLEVCRATAPSTRSRTAEMMSARLPAKNICLKKR
ncbi:MAG: hypothetical protein A4E36_00846 [Methanoregulaceae archaeon PtaB.Bin009]|nr:MAG: hypothetical protein A4E36_00846 [Methanoregulaceae archaeon PtaB.Bin009]